MVKKEIALQIQTRALNAVKELNIILSEKEDKCSAEDYTIIKRGVGLSLGTIQMEILEYINHQYPEIDDLKN